MLLENRLLSIIRLLLVWDVTESNMDIEEPNCEAMFTKDDPLIFKFDEDEENTMPSFVGLPAFEKKELLT